MGGQLCWRFSNAGTRKALISGFVVIFVLIIAYEQLAFAASKCKECKASLRGIHNDVSRLSSFGQLRSLLPPYAARLQLQGGRNLGHRNPRVFKVTSSSQVDCKIGSASVQCPKFNEILEEEADFVGQNVESEEGQEDQERENVSNRQQRETLDDESTLVLPGASDSDAGYEDAGSGLNGNFANAEAKSDVEVATVEDQSQVISRHPPSVESAWFYAKQYKHPEAKLRLLEPRIHSTKQLQDRTITIVTQTSPDRLPALESLCMTWAGALCIAVHVRLESQHAEVHEQLKKMHERLEGRGRCWLDLQMATEDGFESDAEALAALYPVNALRNVAMDLARTELLFLLDADFQPSYGLHENLTKDEATYSNLLTSALQHKQLFVVPAFEATNTRRRTVIPQTMEDLKAGWEMGAITYFHSLQSPSSHVPTNFTKFFDPATESPYAVSYREGFEPYVIGARNAIPLYDTRFRGYGGNKESHLYLCAARGMNFQVLPKAFVFKLPHRPSEARQSYVGRNRNVDQRNRIIGLYSQFKGEVEVDQMNEDAARFQQFLRNLGRPV